MQQHTLTVMGTPPVEDLLSGAATKTRVWKGQQVRRRSCGCDLARVVQQL